MLVDMIATLINQRHLIRCIERLESIDQRLETENITIDYKPIQRLSYVIISVATMRNILMLLFYVLAFPFVFFNTFASLLPIFISTLSKAWFVLIVFNISQKFNAINGYLENLCVTLKHGKHENRSVQFTQDTVDVSTDFLQKREKSRKQKIPFHYGYLQKEILPKPPVKKTHLVNTTVQPMIQIIKPFESSTTEPIEHIEVTNVDYLTNETMRKRTGPTVSHASLIIDDKFDKKLMTFCFIHDEICEIGKIANYMFSFQMLILMAYGFLSVTAQFYFVYCGLVGQVSI